MTAPADILCVRGHGWLADAIVRAEYGPNPPANAVSHAGIITAVNGEVQVTEALTRVETHPLSVTLANCRAAWLIHRNGLTDAQRLAIVDEVLRFSAASYDYFGLGLQGLDALLRTTWFTDKLAWRLGRVVYCSELAARGYAQVGIGFGSLYRSTKPSDIMETAQALPVFYSVESLFSMPHQIKGSGSR